MRISRISACCVTLDLDICTLASLPRVPAFFKLVEITMATVNPQVLPAMNAISIWAECNNMMPLK